MWMAIFADVGVMVLAVLNATRCLSYKDQPANKTDRLQYADQEEWEMSEVNLPHDHGQNIEKVLERMPDTDECVVVAEVFKQISDGSRIRILWLLCHCEECVSNIAAAMNMSDPAVSHHLKLLKKSGLITSRREGKEIYYKLADSETAQLLHHIIEEMFRITCPLN